MRLAIFGVALAITSLPSAAHADWQYTNWGMTVDQVVAAAGSQVTATSGTPGDVIEGLAVGAKGTYMIGTEAFPATFYFQHGGLARVKLAGESDSVCWALEKKLGDQYGSPFSRVDAAFMQQVTWKDAGHENRVEFTSFGDSCSLYYVPITSDTGSGL